MDAHESATDVARALNVKLPRLHRHASGRNVRTDGHRLVLGQSAVAALRERLGVLPPVEGLTRAQVQALVALSRRPRGLVSVRQVAKAARLSPTAASRALAKLMSLGLATRTTEKLFDSKVDEDLGMHDRLVARVGDAVVGDVVLCQPRLGVGLRAMSHCPVRYDMDAVAQGLQGPKRRRRSRQGLPFAEDHSQ